MLVNREQLLRAIARHAEATAESGPIDLVEAVSVDVAGRVATTAGAGATRRVALLGDVERTTIVDQLDAAYPRCERIYCALGVLEPGDEGLVIVELAPGVSAVELQSRVDPTLKITHLVREMVLD